jgi:hypothetical protein
MRVFAEYRVLRGISAPKRKLGKRKQSSSTFILFAKYFCGDKIKDDMCGSMYNAYNVLVGKPEGKKPLEKPRCRWEYYIKKDRDERPGFDSRQRR